MMTGILSGVAPATYLDASSGLRQPSLLANAVGEVSLYKRQSA